MQSSLKLSVHKCSCTIIFALALELSSYFAFVIVWLIEATKRSASVYGHGFL